MRRYVLAILAASAIIHSCKNHPQGDCCAELDTLEYIKTAEGNSMIDPALLKGAWEEIADSTLGLTINDSVRYRQSPGVAYPYSLRNDSLFISVENIPFTAKIVKATADSLVLENKGIVTRYSKKGQ